jgi:peptidoglycan biosynthesis protein MviN/MurJ (putative lipid II flippase)
VTLWFFAAAPIWTDLAFQRGAFSGIDMQQTAHLLSLYSIAIVPNGLAFLLARSFQAQRDVMTPLTIGVVNTLLYVGAAVLLTQALGLDGLPLAFAFSQGGTLVLSLVLLFKKINGQALIDGVLARIILLGALLAAALFVWVQVLEPGIALSNPAYRIAGLVVSVVASLIIYWGLALFLGIPEARTFAELIPFVRPNRS